MKVRGALTDLAPNGNLSCLLTTADPDLALQTHFLYEMGGNIGKLKHCIFHEKFYTLGAEILCIFWHFYTAW
jgi:hypothetical protein